MALANGYATNEQTKLLPRDDDVAHVAPTRRLGVIAIFVVIWAWVVQAEAAQALQDASHFSKPFFIVCFNHTVTVVMLPLVFLYHRLHDGSNAKRGFFCVLQRHSVLPLGQLTRMAAFLSIFYCFADYFWYAALANVSVAAGTAIFNCSPFFVYCFSLCFLHERVSCRKLAGVIMSFAGVTLVVLFQDGSSLNLESLNTLEGASFVASLLVVVSAAIYGAYEVAVRVVVGQDIEDTSTLLILTGLCGLLSIPIWIVGSFLFAVSPFPTLYEPLGWPVTGQAVGMLVLSGSLAAVFNVAFPFALCWTSPLETSVGCMLTIPLSGLWDTMFHHMHFSWECILGSTLVMAGFGVLEYTSKPEHAIENGKMEARAVSSGDVVV